MQLVACTSLLPRSVPGFPRPLSSREGEGTKAATRLPSEVIVRLTREFEGLTLETDICKLCGATGDKGQACRDSGCPAHEGKDRMGLKLDETYTVRSVFDPGALIAGGAYRVELRPPPVKGFAGKVPLLVDPNVFKSERARQAYADRLKPFLDLSSLEYLRGKLHLRATGAPLPLQPRPPTYPPPPPPPAPPVVLPQQNPVWPGAPFMPFPWPLLMGQTLGGQLKSETSGKPKNTWSRERPGQEGKRPLGGQAEALERFKKSARKDRAQLGARRVVEEVPAPVQEELGRVD